MSPSVAPPAPPTSMSSPTTWTRPPRTCGATGPANAASSGCSTRTARHPPAPAGIRTSTTALTGPAGRPAPGRTRRPARRPAPRPHRHPPAGPTTGRRHPARARRPPRRHRPPRPHAHRRGRPTPPHRRTQPPASPAADRRSLSRRQHRSAERLAQAWAEELAAARHHWNTVAGPTERHLLDALDDAEDASSRLGAQRALQALDRASGHGIHARIAAIDRELESIDAGLPNAPAANRPVEISLGLGLSL
jgi:hypothetical protein